MLTAPTVVTGLSLIIWSLPHAVILSLVLVGDAVFLVASVSDVVCSLVCPVLVDGCGDVCATLFLGAYIGACVLSVLLDVGAAFLKLSF